MPDIPFTQGLYTLSDDCHVWLEPDGGWGFSNSRLVVGNGQSLLIDTLFDPPMTENMVAHMHDLVEHRPITTLFNTHSDGDHWFGNQIVTGADIIATETSATEMRFKGPASIDRLRQLPGETGDFAREAFGPFDWENVTPTFPTTTFDRELALDVGGTEVQLLNLGPAHTGGDAIAWVPGSKTLFAGDLLFNGGTPIVWAGPVEGWIRACDAMEELGAETVVPGHGPVPAVQTISYAPDDVWLLAPIPRPPSLRDFMVAEEHVRRSFKDDPPKEWWNIPVYYKGNCEEIYGPEDTVPWPAYTERLDYELEMCAVIGARGRNVSAERADDLIVGYTIYNDWSARDIQMREM